MSTTISKANSHSSETERALTGAASTTLNKTSQALRVRFDLAASASGPGRYVTSVMKGLTAAGCYSTQAPATRRPSTDASDDDTREANGRSGSVGGFARSVAPTEAKIVLGAIREARRAAKAIRGQGDDLFHAQNTGCETAPIAARWAGVPIVLGTFHTDSTYDLDRERDGWGHRLIERYSNRCLHHAIAVSEATKRDWIRRTGIAEENVTTIHNGVCPQTYRRKTSSAEARGGFGLPVDRVLVGAVGRLERAKGHADLIRAMERIASERDNVDLVIAGKGPLEHELASLADRLGLASRVRLLGQVSNVNTLYDALDVYTMPSLCEAHPYALLEATAHGLPAVTSRAGGMPETVVDGETGFLFDVGDAAGLAAALTHLLDSQELRERFGHAGRVRVEQHFAEDNMIRKTLALYERLLERRLRQTRES